MNEILRATYSAKTDDELLVLAAEEDSLREEAKRILADELVRRNLHAVANGVAQATEARSGNRRACQAKWLGLWLLTTLIASLGTLINTGIVTESLRPFISRAAKIHFVETFVYGPYYPLPVVIGLLIGFFSYLRFRGTYRYWVWVLPAINVLNALVGWKQSNQTSWSNALIHFSGTLPYPGNREQLDSTLFLYTTVAYIVGVCIQTFIEGIIWPATTRFSRTRISGNWR